jgi:TPR repeat protein
MTRQGGSLAVLIGAVVGVTAALARRGDEMPAPTAAERQQGPVVVAEPAVLAAPAAPAPPSTEPARAEVSVLPLASASEPRRRLPAPMPIASPEELRKTEVRCYEQDPFACHRAADAYALGSLVPKDEARARTYRKVEVTQLVRQCEKRKPRACLGLADLLAAGDGVARDSRRAEHLSEHARSLCRGRPSEECRALGMP